MSEINGPNFSVNQVKFSGVQKPVQDSTQQDSSEKESTQLTDFSNPKAEALGRSMLFKGADDINHDLKTLLENPQIAENSDRMFETALKIANEKGIENAYEEAATFATGAL